MLTCDKDKNDHTKTIIRNKHSFFENKVSEDISKAFFLVIMKAEMAIKIIKIIT